MFRKLVLPTLGILLCLASPGSAAPWITVHYPAYRQREMRPELIDVGNLTHLIYFAAIPQRNGTLSTADLTEAEAVRKVAQDAGRKVLLCVGGGGSEPGFSTAIDDVHRPAFVKAIAAWVREHRYDGVDVDKEPIIPHRLSGEARTAAATHYKAFIVELETALKRDNPAALLCGDFGGDDHEGTDRDLVAELQAHFDQVNLMTYDLSGPWEGWVTWHDSPLFSGGHTFPSPSKRLLPSCDTVAEFWRKAVPAQKLGLGVNCEAHDWSPQTVPRETLRPRVKMRNLLYREVVTRYLDPSPETGHYDEGAEAAYVSADEHFVSYTDPRQCTAKGKYVAAKGLGGVMMWDVTGQYVHEQNPLLEALARGLGLLPANQQK